MGLTRNISKLIPIGSHIVCTDNSGAKTLSIMGYKKMQGTRKRRLSGGVGSIAVVSVKKGKTELKKKKFYALIVRQKYPLTRKKGAILGKICFTDNAAILLNDDLSLKKTNIKGVIAKEVLENTKYKEISGVIR